MSTKNWTRKDRIACIIIFTICVLTFVVFSSSITLSYFYDEHSANKFITAGEVNIVAKGGPNNDGRIQFPNVLLPNTLYKVDDYKTGSNYNLDYSVKNEGTSGSVYVMLKLDSTYLEWLKPRIEPNVTGEYWVVGDGHSEYLYYMKPLEINEMASLTSAWQVGNISQAVQGSAVTFKITAYAVQTQGDALKALISSNSDGWQYAPQIFKDMAGVTI